jgi:Fe-S-cluster containining protein
LDIARETDTTCQRCGTCCLRGGPALHHADAVLFSGQDALDLSVIVTIRAGEPVNDQVRGRVLTLEHELLKLRGTAGSQACMFYDQPARACGLYQRRPEECRALSCRDTAPLAAMYERDRLRRCDLLPAGHHILPVLSEHEALVPVARIAPLAEHFLANGQEAREAEAELLRMAATDQAFRRKLAEHAGIGQEYHEFFFGRGAAALFAAAGLVLREDARRGFRIQPNPLWRVRPGTIRVQHTGEADER